MIQSIADQPWAFLAFLAILALLYLGAAARTKRDRQLKARARVDRRKAARAGGERRWSDQRRKKAGATS